MCSGFLLSCILCTRRLEKKTFSQFQEDLLLQDSSLRFETCIQLLVFSDIPVQISAEDNAAIEPLVSALENVLNPDDKFDMKGSAFTVVLDLLIR